MKRSAFSIFLAGIFSASIVSAAAIPYPAGLNTTEEGASSYPAEINHRHSEYFVDNDYFNMKSNDHRIILSHFPTYQQTREYTCGPAAGLTVLYYFGNQNYDEMSLAEGMKTQGYPIGSNPKDMADFFRSIGWYVDTSLEHEKFEDYSAFQNWVVENLKSNTPIMVENIEWGGHWRVIIGYDSIGTETSGDDVLIFVDPYDTSDHDQDGYAVGNGERFFYTWFDHSMLPKDQAEQPWIITRPYK